MSTQIIASWTPTLKRGATFTATLTFTDEAGSPVTFLSAEIVITPNDASPLSWTQDNGMFTNAAPGVYDVLVDSATISGYAWSSGKYRLNVVEASGFLNPCYIEGLIFVKDC